jgi:hypothetical protein
MKGRSWEDKKVRKITNYKLQNKKIKGSHGLHQGTFKL